MIPFLKQISDYLKTCYENKMPGVCIVFPNMRPSLYFRSYFAQGNEKPMWAPEIYTITQFFENHSTLAPKDELSMMFDLYKTYLELTSSNETFDSFYGWAQVLLADFDDVDTYLANAQNVFSNIKDLKEIDSRYADDDYVDKEVIKAFWGNILSSRSSEERDIFMSTWKILPDLYNLHREALKKEGFGSQGMISREVAESPENIDLSKTYCFAGFNVLNECEKAVFRYLKKQGKALFFWDIDDYYILNPNHEAGHFMRQNVKHFPMPEDFILKINNILETPPKISCIAAPSSVSQVKYAGTYISEKIKKGEFIPSETAVILGNEDLLSLLLQSIPQEVGPYNVSMGVNIKDSPAVSWIRNIILLQTKVRHTGEYKFYFKYVNALLNHPFTNILSDNSAEALNEILTNKIIYISPQLFKNKEFLEELFTYTGSNIAVFSNYLMKMLAKFLTSDKEASRFTMQREIVYQIYKSLKYLNQIIIEKQIVFSGIATFSHLVEQIIKTTVVPFEGEPLEGMQVMGLLETRLLDFRNIIILSMNEGVLPKSSIAPSFIPVNLRYAFNLPTQQHVDSLYSYYFYRLLHRSNNITLIYKMATKDVGGGERSRFIQQLKFELPHAVTFSQMNYNVRMSSAQTIVIEKNAEISEFLYLLAQGKIQGKKLSASVLNMYIKCPLAFYFSTVAGMKEPDSIDEDTNMKQFGNIFHKAMELIYQPFAENKKTINATDLKVISDIGKSETIEKSVLSAFNIEYKTDFTNKTELYGKQRLIYEILVKYTEKLIRYDITKTPFTIAYLEKNLIFNLPLEDNNESNNAVIKAKIDRIDYVGDTAMVMDYKTGKAKRSCKSLNELFERGRKKDLDYVFQILLYCLMLRRSEKYNGKIQPAVISLPELFGDAESHISIKADAKSEHIINNFDESLEKDFTNFLLELVSEITNANVPFVQYPEKTKCSYCIFNNICCTS